MEFCRTCGGSGHHVRGCPAAPPPPEKEAIPGFTENEVDKLVCVRDLGDELDPALVKRVNADNIEQVIEAGQQVIVDLRNKGNESLRSGSLQDAVLENYNRSCLSHAVQCSIDRGIDYQLIVDKVDELPESERESDEARDVRDVFDLHVKMNEQLTELYKLEIAHRLDKLKGGKGLFEKVSGRFSKIAESIEALVVEYENKFGKFIDDNEGQKELVEQLKAMLNDLKEADTNELEGRIAELAEIFSRLQFQDTEFRWDEIVDKAKRLSPP